MWIVADPDIAARWPEFRSVGSHSRSDVWARPAVLATKNHVGHACFRSTRCFAVETFRWHTWAAAG